MATSAELQNVQAKVLRKVNVAEANFEAGQGTTVADYTELLIERAETSTEPVLIMYDAILGHVPTEAQLDGAAGLAAFALAQFNAYAAKGVANPELGPYEALGRALSSTSGFHAQSDGKADAQFIVDAYVKAFGGTPGGAQVAHFEDQINYFTNLYKGAGLSAADAALQARGAVYGQIFGIAATVEDSPLDLLAENFMRKAVTGAAVYDAPLTTSVAPGPDPDVQSVDLTPNTDAGAAFSLGVGDDTFNAQVQQTAFLPIQTLNNTDNLNGGEGRDTLNAQLVNAFTVPAGLFGIEVLNVDGAPGFITPAVTLDVINADALDTIGFRAPTNNVTINNVKTSLDTVNISNETKGIVNTINFVGTALAGASDELTVNVNNVGQGAGSVNLVLGGAGTYETLNVNSTGGVQNEIDIKGSAAAATNVNIGGDTDLNINSPQSTAWNVASLHNLDATALNANLNTDFKGTGNITVKGAQGVNDLLFHTTGVVNVTTNDAADLIQVGTEGLFQHSGGLVTINSGGGADSIDIWSSAGSDVNAGAGDDTIRYRDGGGAASFTSADKANGGDGNDTLIIETSGAVDRQLLGAGVGAGIIGIETIRHEGAITAGQDLLVDMSQTGSANVVQLAGTYSDDVRVTNMTNAQTQELVTDIEANGGAELVLGHAAGIVQTFNVQFDGGVHVQFVESGAAPGEIDGYFFKSIGTDTNGIHDASGLDADVGITGTQDFFLGDSAAHAFNVSNGLVSGVVSGVAFTGNLDVWLGGGFQTAVGGAGNDFIATTGGDDAINLSAGGTDTVFMVNASGVGGTSLATAANFTHVSGWSNDIVQLDISNLALEDASNNTASTTVLQQNLGFNDTVNATGTAVNYIKLTTTVSGAANTATTNALFDAAIGGGQVGINGATDNILVSAYDAQHGQMVLFTVDADSGGSANALTAADNVSNVVGVVAMSAADYAAFSASNLHLVA